MQRANFPFEVIVIEDGSTDRTLEVVQEYENNFVNLRIIRNGRNLGKGESVRRAYGAAQGRYIHVLDADDLFVSYDKIQRQFDALESEPDISAVAHNTAILYPDQTLDFVNGETKPGYRPYADVMGFRFYHHTSSYMIRRLPEPMPEEFGTVKPLRGDSAWLYFHCFKMKKGVRYFPDLSSVYNFHGQGLWSRLNEGERARIVRDLFEALQALVVRDPESEEHRVLESKIAGLSASTQGRGGSEEANRLGGRIRPEEVLQSCLAVARKVYEPEIYDRLFRGMHSLRLVDQLCETVGRLLMVQAGFSFLARGFDRDQVAFLVSGLQPKGGGVFNEISELIAIHLAAGQRVLIVVSGMSESDEATARNRFSDSRVKIEFMKDGTLIERVRRILDIIYTAAPVRLYPFVSHHDVVSCAAIQKGLAGEVIMDFVYDHGSSLGLSNSSIDTVILKSVRQLNAVAQVVPRHKLRVVPPLFEPYFKDNPYRPLKNGFITTASAAARSYKVEMNSDAEYCEIVASILRISSGSHYHFGPLSAAYKARILASMDRQGVPAERFIHVPYAAQFSKALHESGVDLFLMPFPVTSARIGVEVMSCGIPLVCFQSEGATMPEAVDFCDPNQWSWSRAEELYEVVAAVSRERLLEKSASARAYFERFNDRARNGSRLLDLTNLAPPDAQRPGFEVSDIIENELCDLTALRELLVKGRGPKVEANQRQHERRTTIDPAGWLRRIARRLKSIVKAVAAPLTKR